MVQWQANTQTGEEKAALKFRTRNIRNKCYAIYCLILLRNATIPFETRCVFFSASKWMIQAIQDFQVSFAYMFQKCCPPDIRNNSKQPEEIFW